MHFLIFFKGWWWGGLCVRIVDKYVQFKTRSDEDLRVPCTLSTLAVVINLLLFIRVHGYMSTWPTYISPSYRHELYTNHQRLLCLLFLAIPNFSAHHLNLNSDSLTKICSVSPKLWQCSTVGRETDLAMLRIWLVDIFGVQNFKDELRLWKVY